MAPTSTPQREISIEPRPEYDEFIAKLAKFHEKRGTTFDSAPRVGNKRVDLLRLYDRVNADGGYDNVSDTKKIKLAWRNIGQEFKLGSNQALPTLAFTLKTAYYKNLAYVLPRASSFFNANLYLLEPMKLSIYIKENLHPKKSLKMCQLVAAIYSLVLPRIIYVL